LARRKKDDEEERYSAFIGIQLKPSQRRALEAQAANSDIKLSHFARAVLVRESATTIQPGRDKKVLRELAAELVGGDENPRLDGADVHLEPLTGTTATLLLGVMAARP
jgi:hypothetical protein